MTTRRPPPLQRHRPSSQVYIGKDSTFYLANPPDIPDLPEPPSPGSSSSTSTGVSGLPSPPATNSTGSGSTGDPGSIAVRGGGARMLNGSNIKTFHAAFQAEPHNDEHEDYDDDPDDGEDNTARLDQRRHSASENVLALQRVKSLTQRNRLALDKLSSFSRLSSPSPSTRPPPGVASPPPSLHSTSSSSHSNSNSNTSTSSSSASSSSMRPSLRRARTHDQRGESGSETERDDEYRPATPLTHQRTRLLSAPASPQKHLTSSANSNSASSSSNTNSSTRSPRRTRMSTLAFEDGGPEDVARAALAAVASARNGTGTARYTGTGTSRMSMSPTSSASAGKRRQPLPREWGAGSSASGSGSGSGGRFSTEPLSPQTSPSKRHSLSSMSTATSSMSPSSGSRHAHSNSTSSTSTIGTTAAGRSSTVRELARRHQARWVSEDLGGGSNAGSVHGGASGNGNGNGNGLEERDRERRQSLRAGSAESALLSAGGGRSLVGEGLRAAGLAVRGGDVFSPPEQRERTPGRVEWADGVRSQSRLGGHGRAATSMADYATPRKEEYASPRREEYGHNQEGREEGEPRLRAYRSSAHVLDAGRAGSALGRYRGPSVERGEERYAPSPSPFGSVRRHVSGGSGGGGQEQHTRLMMDSLGMFEGHLARVAGAGEGAAAELARNAQALVGAAERLNAILRAGTGRALEEQIDAEVRGVDGEGGGDALVEVWRRVGGEYREGLRVSDELVRGVTGFLLGVGRVVRDFGGEGHGPDEGRGSASPEVVGRGGDGRRSAESRRSWEAGDDRRSSAAGGRESALGVRPSSVLNSRHETTPQSAPRPPAAASRRLLTPREQRELASGMVASDSQETVQQKKSGYEPSPTPASRKQNEETLGRSRTLPPISIPKPLPTLPSESASTLRRNQTTGDKPTGGSAQRRRTLTSTVRGASGLLPSVTTPTTALTPHTVSNAPPSERERDARMTFPAMPRNDSDRSLTTTRGRNNTVTFSRPSTVALAGLQIQHARERQRTISSSSAFEEAPARAGEPSGSETERDARGKQSVAARERPRMSLDGGVESVGHAADRSAAAVLSVAPGQKRERRRTVTDIWPSGS
ncbi:hypothetical protein C8J57DRAFT_1594707 [Mycena rebaudengoi]|nr:hypothetical protein C8J57DRAFT_1594707 [Mycena rebaudengoi]